jgi:methyl-accepting chemotaxis protein
MKNEQKPRDNDRFTDGYNYSTNSNSNSTQRNENTIFQYGIPLYMQQHEQFLIEKVITLFEEKLDQKLSILMEKENKIAEIKELLENMSREMGDLKHQIQNLSEKVNMFEKEKMKLSDLVNRTGVEVEKIKKDIETVLNTDKSSADIINKFMNRLSELERNVVKIETKIEKLETQVNKKDDRTFQWILSVGVLILSILLNIIMNAIIDKHVSGH